MNLKSREYVKQSCGQCTARKAASKPGKRSSKKSQKSKE